MAASENICKFASSTATDNDLFAFQFIYEADPGRLGVSRSYAAFVCHLVMTGNAKFTAAGGSYTLAPGDLFFTFPSSSFHLEPDPDFKYCYIAFVGNHATELLESLGVSRADPVRSGHCDLQPLWFKALERCTSDNLNFFAKGILYCTFAYLKKSEPAYTNSMDCNSVVKQIQEAVDQDYSDSDLSLERLCKSYGYNVKYISRKFRQNVGIGFSDYLINCRIRHACILLTESSMTIREIATTVGYPDALYFSKVFKRIMKASPSEYRRDTDR